MLFVSLRIPAATLDAGRRSASTSRALVVEIQDCRSRSRSSTTCPKNPVGKIDKPTLRQRLLETRLKHNAATSQRSRNHGIHQAGLSPTSIRTPSWRKPLMERMRILATALGRERLRLTADGACHLHREAGLLLRPRRGPGGDGDLGASGVLACRRSGGTSRSSTRRPSCGRCCSRRSASPGRGGRWPARSSR